MLQKLQPFCFIISIIFEREYGFYGILFVYSTASVHFQSLCENPSKTPQSLSHQSRLIVKKVLQSSQYENHQHLQTTDVCKVNTIVNNHEIVQSHAEKVQSLEKESAEKNSDVARLSQPDSEPDARRENKEKKQRLDSFFFQRFLLLIFMFDKYTKIFMIFNLGQDLTFDVIFCKFLS